MSLRERFEAKVSPEPMSGCWLWTGSVAPNGYGLFWADGKYEGAHRVAYRLAHGGIPAGKSLDHSCHTKSCVNPSHLRPCSVRQNASNLRGKRDGKFSSRFTGVSLVRWNKDGSTYRWTAHIWLNGRLKHLGGFKTEEEAAARYNEVRKSVDATDVS
jgi:hypothetical protein